MSTNPELNPQQIALKYAPLVHSIARRMISNPEIVKDATQEVWYEILKSLPSFRGKSQLSTWIYQIASRVILRYAQNERRYSMRVVDDFFSKDEIPVPSDVETRLWLKEQCSQCFTAFLHCLDNEARLVFILREISGLAYDEISGIILKEEAALRKTHSRSRAKIKNYMTDNCPIFNPEGKCRCRIKRHLASSELLSEFQSLLSEVKSIEIFRIADIVIPLENFWKKVS